jgi:hypothetical protein
MTHPQAAEVGREWGPAELPRRPFLFVNPSSGGGRATRAGPVDRARARGIQVVVLTPHQDLAASVREAVASGTDALAVAGGDGSLGPCRGDRCRRWTSVRVRSRWHEEPLRARSGDRPTQSNQALYALTDGDRAWGLLASSGRLARRTSLASAPRRTPPALRADAIPAGDVTR